MRSGFYLNFFWFDSALKYKLNIVKRTQYQYQYQYQYHNAAATAAAAVIIAVNVTAALHHGVNSFYTHTMPLPIRPKIDKGKAWSVFSLLNPELDHTLS